MDLSEPFIGNVSIIDLIAFFAVLFATGVLAKALYALMRRYLDRVLTKTTSKKISKLTQYVVIAVGLYLGFWEVLHLDFPALVVSLGIVGIAIALASQQVIQNAFAGVLLSIAKPFELEDWVEVGGLPVTGLCKVSDITLISTVMRDLDGRLLYVPNSFILSNKLINYTKGGFVALNIPLWVAAGKANLDVIRKIALEEAQRNEYILPKVKGKERPAIAKALEKGSLRKILGPKVDMRQFDPQVTIAEMAGTKVRLNIKIWIREVNMRDQIISQYLESLKARFEAEGVELAS
ncbi:MAG: mechanosensitive ion channel [Thermoplasmata archaeon]